MSEYDFIEIIGNAVIQLEEMVKYRKKRKVLLKESENIRGREVEKSGKEIQSGLEETVRRRLEYVLQKEIPEVIIHRGGSVQEELRGEGAYALTSGRDIYIREEMYKEGSEITEAILLHELTHTIQMEEKEEMRYKEEIAEAEEEAYEKEKLGYYKSEKNYYGKIGGEFFYMNDRIGGAAVAYGVRGLREIIEKYIREENVRMVEAILKTVGVT